ncbi:MAG: flagellin [bacterium]
MIGIQTNIWALDNLNKTAHVKADLNLTYERLSSGKRINRGADDPSGVGLITNMQAQYRGLHVSMENAQDGLKWLEARDRSMNEQFEILNRMRDLCLRASNEAVLTTADRQIINDELTNLRDEFTRIGSWNHINYNRTLFEPGQLDVIWVLDDTRSMLNYVAALQGAAPAMFQQFAEKGFDLRMAAVGFDDGLRLTLADSKSFQSTATGFDGDVQIIRNFIPTCPTGFEYGIEAVTTALNYSTLGADFREDARKVVIVITDEDADDFYKGAWPFETVYNWDQNDPTLHADPNGLRDALRDRLAQMDVTMHVAGVVSNQSGVTSNLPDQDYSSIATDPQVGGLAIELDNPPLGATAAWVSTITTTLLAEGGPWDDRFHIGPESDEFYHPEYHFDTIVAAPLAIKGVDVMTTDNAHSSVDAIDRALDIMAEAKNQVGYLQNAFHTIINNLTTNEINIRATHARIENADMAVEVANMVREQLLSQTGISAQMFANGMTGQALELVNAMTGG